mmetsp:Transcript_25764/g.79257  ORF Transcript_25764/g.79257 Transcript_25764/m.79257 type:complete len:598 (+) Transcript_25764:66-1859(+)
MPAGGFLELSGGVRVPVAVAEFGRALPTSRSRGLRLTLRFPPRNRNRDGCAVETEWWDDDADGALLSARSPNCTFAERAVAASRAGVAAVVVYATPEGVYSNRTFAEPSDYDCANGRSWVASRSGKWRGFPDSDCAKTCFSSRCLLTGATGEADGKEEICCAWDPYVTMSGHGDAAMAYARMRDYDAIVAAFGQDAEVEATLWAASDSTGSWLGAVGIWALGVLICAVAAKTSAQPLYDSGEETSADDKRSREGLREEGGPSTESLELTPMHALGFVGVASTSLLVLFFTNDGADLFVSVAFAVAAACAAGAVFWRPFLHRLVSSKNADRASLVAGAALAVWWLLARRQSYAWVLQDYFGSCVCVAFLRVVKVNSLRVGAVLSCLAFCYDVFFVFVSPYVFGQSVMVKVATGSPSSRDAAFCEEHPDDASCQSTQLPMLLLLPGADGGYSMLGLGDVVLPGLLVALAARLDDDHRHHDDGDDATRDTTPLLTPKSSVPQRRRYFPILLVGYGVGLGLANVAVAVFDVGQPALLYLVPATLGPFLAVAHYDGLLPALWGDPKRDDTTTAPAQTATAAKHHPPPNATTSSTTTALHISV